MCPVCAYEGKFLLAGANFRVDAMCPDCQSLERHRLFAIWFKDNRDVFTNANLLHFAPEPIIRNLVSKECHSYQSADIIKGRADLVLNLEEIALPDESLDVVICFHVLEHVRHDVALSEIYRILRMGGKAILSFPIIEGWATTYDVGPLSSDLERTQHYGQWDHIKYFGRSIRQDIENAGFELTEITAVEPQVLQYSLSRGQKLFIAQKKVAVL